MLGKDFRNLAEAVTRTYGSNPWFFLRELAQNSRDAGARNIWVKAERTAAGFESLTFADDGRGMTSIHARRFLFRLYASDKTGDKMSAGKYGIGFWTILNFRPVRIVLESRNKKDSWAVVLDADLEAQPAPCPLTCPGTTIVLTRQAVFSTADEFSQTVENELRGYCQYLRRNDRQGSMLPVYFHGQNVTIPMRLPGPLSVHFHSGAVEGAVGLAEKPLVRLYARGLPVWEGALLDQMSHLQNRPQAQSEIGQGLAPVFLLNGNRLDVTFSRNMALENRALKKVRRIAEKALQQLLANSLERAFPRKWHQRGRDRLRAYFSNLRQQGWKLLLLALLVILPLEIIILNRFFPDPNMPGRAFSDTLNYPGAAVNITFSDTAVPFTYQPPIPCWFKVFVAVDYDIQAGFIRRADRVAQPLRPFQPCTAEKTIRMQLNLSGAGRTLLPLPLGHAIDPGSLVFTDRSIQKGQHLTLAGNSRGESSADIPAGLGTIAYQSCPQTQELELDFAEISSLTRLPEGLTLPETLEKSLANARELTTIDKAALANALVRELIRYDTSGQTAQAYQQFASGRAWLDKVLAIGKGDCDVINGLHVLLLRKMGIPARLVIGLIGNQGRIGPSLHAWSEYFDRGWQIADASSGAAETIMPALGTDRFPLAVNAPHPGPAPAPFPGSIYATGSVAPLLAFIAFILALIIFFNKKRNKPRPKAMAAATAKVSREFLLPIIQQALLQPKIWGRESPLWNHRFLPTINGKPMTISRALRMLRRGHLLFTAGPNPLTTAMKGKGVPILDASEELFAPLLNLLSGAVNLDLLCRLQPQRPSRANGTADGLLAAVNALLRKISAPNQIVLLSPGLDGFDFMNVRLPVSPSQSRIFFPQHFIAINPSGREFNDLSALYKKNRSLAIFRFLKVLHSESLLTVADPETLLKKAARRLLRQCP